MVRAEVVVRGEIWKPPSFVLLSIGHHLKSKHAPWQCFLPYYCRKTNVSQILEETRERDVSDLLTALVPVKVLIFFVAGNLLFFLRHGFLVNSKGVYVMVVKLKKVWSLFSASLVTNGNFCH